MFRWTVRVMDGVNFSRLLKFYQTRFTVVLYQVPTERNKFAWVKLSLDFSLRFCSLSLTRHNYDNILGKKNTPSSQINNIYTPPKSQKGVFKKNFCSARFARGAPLFDTPISKILHKTLHTILRVTDTQFISHWLVEKILLIKRSLGRNELVHRRCIECAWLF